MEYICRMVIGKKICQCETFLKLIRNIAYIFICVKNSQIDVANSFERMAINAIVIRNDRVKQKEGDP